MEYLIYIGGAILFLFVANFFLEIGVSIILSVLIVLVSSFILAGGYGAGLLSGEVEFFDEPMYAISLIASGITLVAVWFFEGMNLIILLVVWALFQLLSAGAIMENSEGFRNFFSEEEVLEDNG